MIVYEFVDCVKNTLVIANTLSVHQNHSILKIKIVICLYFSSATGLLNTG